MGLTCKTFTKRFVFCRFSHEKGQHSTVINKRQKSLLSPFWLEHDFYMKEKEIIIYSE